MSVKIYDMLGYALESGASDLHLSVGSVPMVRLHGHMKKLDMPVMTQSVMKEIKNDILDENQKTRLEKYLEIDFSAKLEGKGRFRVNFFNQINGYSAVFRTIPSAVQSTEQLNIPPILNQLALKEKGLILLTGPTGSGKSTTLAAMIQHINENKDKHIITIEDPVEYYHESNNCLINQRELGQSTHSFANALKSALREDPDVILVGEMRDLETIQLALTAAETGHLVLSTLHTSSAVKTIDRIIDVFPAGQKSQIRSMLSESLLAVVAQKLLSNSKKNGRVPASEIMIATSAIRNLIREDKIYQIPTLIQSGSKEGMQSLDGDLQRLLNQGVIDRNEAISVAENPKIFEQGIF
ncbi:MAG: type IV pilus twitching motility protein PilT [Candidatus Neomarinimicrobiota bacterium]|nr:type IV pilus twitching motility protein PilT [Candidatus Neomarinimicrobiota bacterium]|tara:strand:+ start:652 stop:1710 length:1059 start_codon:yes stop_codon:yes gene_type:complete